MAGLEDLLGGILGGASGGQRRSNQAGNIPDLNRIMMMVGPLIAAFAASGGLQNLLKKLTSNGLGGQVNSWVSTGSNEPISADQVQQALPDEVAQISAQTGLGQDEVANGLSAILPGLVDKVTPAGELPQEGSGNSSLNDVLGQLPGGDLLKGMFGR